MIRAILVDDEKPALEKLGRLLEQSGLVEVAGMFDSPAEALEAAKNIKFDAVFLDIEMPEIDGIALADKLFDLDSKAAVVFVTAYNEYAIEAFELNALDYLLKPVKRERLQKTLERIIRERNIPVEPVQARVNCFGRFKILAGQKGGSEIKWRTSKAEELLAFLIHHRGEAVNKHQIIDSLWQEYDADKAATYFNTTVYYLRKNLSIMGIEGLIQNARGLYKIEADKIYCDYYKFEKLVSTGGPINSNNIEIFEEIAGMHKGGYLENNDYIWAEETRHSLENKYTDLLVQMHDYYVKEQKFSPAVEVLKKALQQSPFVEEIHEKLIKVYLLANDRISAMKQYDSLKRKLRTELGIEPGNAVKELLNLK